MLNTGSYVPENTQLLCSQCHLFYSNETSDHITQHVLSMVISLACDNQGTKIMPT